jgi:hypothetical protein
MWNSRDAGDGSDQGGRHHRSQARLSGLDKSEDGDPTPCLSHHPARASFTSGLLARRGPGERVGGAEALAEDAAQIEHEAQREPRVGQAQPLEGRLREHERL